MAASTMGAWIWARVTSKSRVELSPGRLTVTLTVEPCGPRIVLRTCSKVRPLTDLPSTATISSPGLSPTLRAIEHAQHGGMAGHVLHQHADAAELLLAAHLAAPLREGCGIEEMGLAVLQAAGHAVDGGVLQLVGADALGVLVGDLLVGLEKAVPIRAGALNPDGRLQLGIAHAGIRQDLQHALVACLQQNYWVRIVHVVRDQHLVGAVDRVDAGVLALPRQLRPSARGEGEDEQRDDRAVEIHAS